MNPKKEIERFYLNSFFEKMGILARIVRDGDDSGNEPDFFVELEGDEIGVEVTQLFKSIERKGSPDKAKEAQHRYSLLRLADEYYQISDIPINIQRLGNNIMFEGSSHRDVAQRLLEVAGQLGEWEVSQLMVGAGDKLRVHRLPDSLIGYKCWEWVLGHVGFSKPINKKVLEAAVNPKYEKLEGYRRSAERIILLVYADGTWNSGMVHLDECPPTIELRGFETIYLYMHPERAVQVG
jgi:hypothetical protein